MANIQEKILSKYQINISEDNIFKIYEIDKKNISKDELELCIEETKKRWNQIASGTDEKNENRAKEYLKKTENYEKILRDKKIRKSLYDFYSEENKKKQGDVETEGLLFAKDFFQLVQTTKKIHKEDVEFFYNYYSKYRKDKESIHEMLLEDFAVRLGKGEDKIITKNKDSKKEGKKKDESSPFITNSFQEITIIKINECINYYIEAQQSEIVKRRYPDVSKSLYDFLRLDHFETSEAVEDMLTRKTEEIQITRQEQGTEFIPLINLFNTLKNLFTYGDVVDNYKEVKLLIKYPDLSPYMFLFRDMKAETIKQITVIAKNKYEFKDEMDFFLNYYNDINDNFGINNDKISSLIKKSKKEDKQNSRIAKSDKKEAISKKTVDFPFTAAIVHFLAYWPIFFTYLILEIFMMIFKGFKKLYLLVFVALFTVTNLYLPQEIALGNFLSLQKILTKAEWKIHLEEYYNTLINTGFDFVLLSIINIAAILVVYTTPAILGAILARETAISLFKRYDFIGIERTFKKMFSELKDKSRKKYKMNQKHFYKYISIRGIVNLVNVAVLILAIFFVPKGVGILSDKINTYQIQEKIDEKINDGKETEEIKEIDAVEQITEGPSMIITVSAANIRSGPGTKYEIVATGYKGDVFTSTGSEETLDSSKIWYEIYLDEDMNQKGWASEKVIDFEK